MLRKLFFRLTNNAPANRLLIALGLDGVFVDRFALYRINKIDTSLSPQLMAGFSDREDVNTALKQTHEDLKNFAAKNCKTGSRILDIGCGAGAYMADFVDHYQVEGIDLNDDMLKAGRKLYPQLTFHKADFIRFECKEKYDLIYSISMLEFIPPGRLDAFFRKINSCLKEGGVLFLHYPPALKKRDLGYPNLYYIEYSPKVVEAAASRYLTITDHFHPFEKRKFEKYDPKPTGDGSRTFLNAYLLTAIKKPGA